MLIKWNRESGALSIPIIGTNVATTIDGSKLVILMPGWNEVADDVFNQIQPHIVDKMDSGDLEIYAKKEGTGDDVKYVGSPLRDVRADKARDIVNGCFNVELLQTWRQDAKIPTEIRHLVDMQLEKIENVGVTK